MSPHPATVLLAAACGWFLVVAVNTLLSSALILSLSLVLGTWAARSVAVIATTLALTVPAALSMVLIHAPYGVHHIAPLLTSDGLALAGSLSLRFAALMGCVLAAAAALSVAEVSKWMQVSRVGYKAAYVVGASLQSLPQGRQAMAAVRDANRLAGVKIGLRNVGPRVIIPVIARLLTQGAQRGHALAAIGFDEPGPRTLLQPVPDSAAQRALRWFLVLATVVIAWI